MKHTLLIAIAICSLQLFAQPQAINYQGVARNSQGLPLVNRNISLRLSILDSSATGQAVYVETQNVTTNNSGLFNIGIGLGTVVSGTFSSIPWGQGDKWFKTEMDTSGVGNFQLIGTTQFLSVPYAFHSKETERVISIADKPQINYVTSGQLITLIAREGVPIRFRIIIKSQSSNFSYQFLDTSLTPISDTIYWESQIFTSMLGMDGMTHGSTTSSIFQYGSYKSRLYLDEISYKNSVIQYEIPFTNCAFGTNPCLASYPEYIIGGHIEGIIVPSFSGLILVKSQGCDMTFVLK